jgi:hypothetical protein
MTTNGEPSFKEKLSEVIKRKLAGNPKSQKNVREQAERNASRYPKKPLPPPEE